MIGIGTVLILGVVGYSIASKNKTQDEIEKDIEKGVKNIMKTSKAIYNVGKKNINR